MVISGVGTDARDDVTLIEGIQSPIEHTYKIGKKRYVAEMMSCTEKLKVLKGKYKLIGKYIYIVPELTFENKNVQKEIKKQESRENQKQESE